MRVHSIFHDKKKLIDTTYYHQTKAELKRGGEPTKKYANIKGRSAQICNNLAKIRLRMPWRPPYQVTTSTRSILQA